MCRYVLLDERRDTSVRLGHECVVACNQSLISALWILHHTLFYPVADGHVEIVSVVLNTTNRSLICKP